MIINKAAEVWHPYIGSSTGKGKETKLVENKYNFSSASGMEKGKSMSMLDSKRIKSRFFQILKEEDMRRSDTCFFESIKPRKQKNARDHFQKTFTRRKDRMGEILAKERMQIIGLEQQKSKSEHSSSFKVSEVQVRRKGSPYLDTFQHKEPSIDQKHEDRYYKVIALAKTRFSNQRFFSRKPQIPEGHKVKESKVLSNNFLRPRQARHKGEKFSGIDLIEPWEKLQELEGSFDID